MTRAWLLLTLLASPADLAAMPSGDPTGTSLARCLERESNASTAGQTECQATALRDYDRRLNLAYAALLRRLPASAAQSLRQSQRAWITFRDAEDRARTAIYATRSGTMYVPMEAAAGTILTRDRALQLEGYARILSIER
ncbi:lysozyme inhibitor LprI family protein [Sphingomonas sp. NFX23]|uniref:lysozyme inhibitor LprI family protein n=1 Tax=Sphingomonas sp. NFX23 TaxID=2819532 RepID=UPI003CF754FC